MKLIAGQKYFRSENGTVMPFNKQYVGIPGLQEFTQAETVVTGTQLVENEKVAATQSATHHVQPRVFGAKVSHTDLDKEMKADLSDLG